MHIRYSSKRLLYLGYRVLSCTYSVTYSNGFAIIIRDKTTISVISWHHMDTPLCWTVTPGLSGFY